MLKEKLQLGKYLCCKDNVTDRNTERGRKKHTLTHQKTMYKKKALLNKVLRERELNSSH
jgi:hypothetical protein